MDILWEGGTRKRLTGTWKGRMWMPRILPWEEERLPVRLLLRLDAIRATIMASSGRSEHLDELSEPGAGAKIKGTS